MLCSPMSEVVMAELCSRSWFMRFACRSQACSSVVAHKLYVVVNIAAQTYSACHLRHDSARSMHLRALSFQVPHSVH
jgi:hypothetical protein